MGVLFVSFVVRRRRGERKSNRTDFVVVVVLDDDGEDVNGDDMDGGADLADVIHAQDSEEDIDDDVDFGGGAVHNDLAKKMEEDNAANAIIHSAISKEKWQLEVERVGHKLKVNKNAGDSKEWRSHLDQTKKYADQVKTALPDVRYKLEKLQEEASDSVESLDSPLGLNVAGHG